MRPVWLLLLASATACGGSTPEPEIAPPVSTAPAGPTRTDFETIAKKLVGRCAMGGWIERWRSTHEDVSVAKPKVFLEKFADETDQDLDSDYLTSKLEHRMRLSGVYEMVGDPSEADFVALGRLKRLAERTRTGRISVYTALLELENVQTGKRAHTCDATVRGEM